ncbi:hypothetical protein POTOM_014384 [Populus tomentosa]|uniref:Uncharacterized protein n=1 Tax=Populus tomentosa TaxID=118781 RepID=A0A8X8D8F6_POPTO|nr:hypothetical protein POTOM_014384 [Populus tomentosa]
MEELEWTKHKGEITWQVTMEELEWTKHKARKLSVCENTTKLQAMVLFLGLLLIGPLLARPIDLSKKFTASSPSTRAKQFTTEIHPQESKYTPPSRTTADAAAVTSSTTTTVPAAPGSASRQQFKAAFHEVPSGPNPESN